ncbi:MAG: DUF5076 domain-containing protein [Planctomycetes bacterium]|nr:DUF5076 domain-containing protein [Planctomycetota bacterium]
MSNRDELPIPEAAMRDAKSREMIRAWVAEESLWCSINIGSWEGVEDTDEPAAWGILLADVARHVGNALRDMKGADPVDVVLAIREMFLAELGEPTSDHNGDFVQGQEG